MCQATIQTNAGLGGRRHHGRANGIGVEIVDRSAQIVEDGLPVADCGQRGRVDWGADMRYHLGTHLLPHLAHQHRLADAGAELRYEVKNPAVLTFKENRHDRRFGIGDKTPSEQFPRRIRRLAEDFFGGRHPAGGENNDRAIIAQMLHGDPLGFDIGPERAVFTLEEDWDQIGAQRLGPTKDRMGENLMSGRTRERM